VTSMLDQMSATKGLATVRAPSLEVVGVLGGLGVRRLSPPHSVESFNQSSMRLRMTLTQFKAIGSERWGPVPMFMAPPSVFPGSRIAK